MKRIGILGGTFDPVHNGHLLLGKQAYQEYGLDTVWFMPSHIPPHKRDHRIASGEDRMKMLSLALAEYPYCEVSDFELIREGTTYTAQTLALLREQRPDDRFYFIIGADSLFQIESWYEPERVLSLAAFLVSGRDYESGGRTLSGQIGYLSEKYGAEIHILHNEEIDISSAEIRRRLAEGKSVRKDVPEPVLRYITDHKLYQERKGGGIYG